MDTYCLDGHLDSIAAPPLATDLLEMRGKPISVDASAVSFVGTLLLQVLVSARKQWLEDGHAFKVAPVSQALASAAAGLGVALADIGASDADVLAKEGDA